VSKNERVKTALSPTGKAYHNWSLRIKERDCPTPHNISLKREGANSGKKSELTLKLRQGGVNHFKLGCCIDDKEGDKLIQEG